MDQTAGSSNSRVLTWLPDRDRDRIVPLLEEEGISWIACRSLQDLEAGVREGAAALVLSGSLLGSAGIDFLNGAIETQPSWSDLPILILGSGRNRARLAPLLARRANVLLVDLPLRPSRFVSHLTVALRDRKGGIETRNLLEEQSVRRPLPAAPFRGVNENSGPPRACRILLVEDDPAILETMQYLLESLGHRVLAISQGREAVIRAASLQPQVALVDIGLPDQDGYSVGRALRASQGPGLLLIALTGYSRPEDRSRALESGFDAHLSKPFQVDDLLRLLRAFRERTSTRA